MTLKFFVFPKLGPLKTWSEKCLKSPVSEDPSASNMLNVPKHCWNQHQSTCIIFNDQFKTIELVELFLIDTANLKTAS